MKRTLVLALEGAEEEVEVSYQAWGPLRQALGLKPALDTAGALAGLFHPLFKPPSP